mmetsp:Transcript_141536/g.452065  ORF Transcript_141536/g.452065 Transcript_141536/m.452065 type:complete len:320 (+) Transcript_141536:611-1570(+)
MRLDDAGLAEGHLRSQIRQRGALSGIAHNVRALRGLLVGESVQHRVAELRARISHGQRGAALAALGVHHVRACILHVLVHGHDLLLRERLGGGHLREQRQNRRTGMAADHRHVDALDGSTRRVVDELVGPHDIQAGDAADLPRVQTRLLVQLAHGRYHGVHRIDDQAKDRVRAELRASLNDVLGDACVDTQQVSPGHARFPRQAGWHQHQVATCQALRQLVQRLVVLVQGVALDLALLIQVRQVGRDTLRRHHSNGQVEDAQLADVGILRHQQTQWLPDASGAAADANLEAACLATGYNRVGHSAETIPQTCEARHVAA